MASNSAELEAEITELRVLLATITTSGNRHDLEQLLQRKQKRLEAATTLKHVSPPQVEAGTTCSVASEFTTFTEISRFSWDDEGYGKHKVAVYITSGIDGVGNLPAENVTCHFTKRSFDLKIIGLEHKNYRI